MSKSAQYKLTGFTEVGEHIPILKMLDRGWPNYDWPRPLENPMMENYRAFLKWRIERNGMKVERLQPGRNDQIVLVHDPERYSDFEVRNIAANGEIWTGVGTNTRQHFPPLVDVPPPDQPTENMCSLAIRLSYGKFDYFTGGDMPGVPPEGTPSWHDVETPVAKAVGQVESLRVESPREQGFGKRLFCQYPAPESLHYSCLVVRPSRPPGSRQTLLHSALPRAAGHFCDQYDGGEQNRDRSTLGPTQERSGAHLDPGGSGWRCVPCDRPRRFLRNLQGHGRPWAVLVKVTDLLTRHRGSAGTSGPPPGTWSQNSAVAHGLREECCGYPPASLY